MREHAQKLRGIARSKGVVAACVAGALVGGLEGAAGADTGAMEAMPGTHDMPMDDMPMADYPEVATANARKVVKARALLSAVRRNVSRFDTTAEAARLGYKFYAPETVRVGRPAVRHMRKGGAFRGRLLDPTAPQALLFWCPASGRCVLIGVMFRAPADSKPPTYDGIVHWHQHNPMATQMTHVWLTYGIRPAYARCVPFNALERSRGVPYTPYKPDSSTTHPCRDTTGLSGSDEMGGMS